MSGDFTICEICGAGTWRTVYEGPVRDGTFGTLRDGASVARCSGCGAERLEESICPDESFYETDAYRRKLKQALDAGAYFREHDELQGFALGTLPLGSLRGKTVADIGCAGGSFLDCVAGLAARKVAVEPCSIYHESLAKRGYVVFPYAVEAAAELRGRVDLAVSFQVIEHVRNPREFMAEIRPLLAPDGVLLISTPNRNDILMELLPDDFPAFFYRVVHRWYFDAESLSQCARYAGYEVENIRFVHRYGLSNALAWLRDRRPSGRARLATIEPAVDRYWQSYLEGSGRADCIFMLLKPRPST